MNLKKLIIYSSTILLIAWQAFTSPEAESVATNFPTLPESTTEETGIQRAVLAGGCFWGMEGIFERLQGVTDVVSGYSGGSADTATYQQVSTGTTGHAESILITYDAAIINYSTVLKIFFAVAHDPTQRDYQGPDVGTQYRSVIFYLNNTQKKQAEEYIRLLDNSGVFHDKIVTEITKFDAFYPAEDYHQHFMKDNPDYPYIVTWDVPKVEHLTKDYPELVKR